MVGRRPSCGVVRVFSQQASRLDVLLEAKTFFVVRAMMLFAVSVELLYVTGRPFQPSMTVAGCAVGASHMLTQAGLPNLIGDMRCAPVRLAPVGRTH